MVHLMPLRPHHLCWNGWSLCYRPTSVVVGKRPLNDCVFPWKEATATRKCKNYSFSTPTWTLLCWQCEEFVFALHCREAYLPIVARDGVLHNVIVSGTAMYERNSGTLNSTQCHQSIPVCRCTLRRWRQVLGTEQLLARYRAITVTTAGSSFLPRLLLLVRCRTSLLFPAAGEMLSFSHSSLALDRT